MSKRLASLKKKERRNSRFIRGLFWLSTKFHGLYVWAKYQLSTNWASNTQWLRQRCGWKLLKKLVNGPQVFYYFHLGWEQLSCWITYFFNLNNVNLRVIHISEAFLKCYWCPMLIGITEQKSLWVYGRAPGCFSTILLHLQSFGSVQTPMMSSFEKIWY